MVSPEPRLLGDRAPRISIGLPVYNGERFLQAALDSILAQTCSDWELIIADNASTDSTPVIARKAAEADSRIRYIRHAENIGAHRNYNFTLSQARAEYFKWFAHDDKIDARYLAEASAILDSRPDVALVFSAMGVIDEHGHLVEIRDMREDYTDASPYKRFRRYFGERVRGEQVFALTRTGLLRGTRLLRDSPGSDVVVVAELLLRGRMIVLSGPLLLNRDHPDRYSRRVTEPSAIAAWYHSDAARIGATTRNRLKWYLEAIRSAPIRLATKLRCYLFMVQWTIRKSPALISELREGRGVGRTDG